MFLDRDGTVIEDTGYPSDPAAVRLLPGVAEALVDLRRMGFRVILVSNQSGVGRGLVTPAQAAAVHEQLVRLLSADSAELDAAYYCPHCPDEGCSCRKPAPGMISAGAIAFGLDLAVSFMVGNKPSDIEAGRRAGCRTVLLSEGGPSPEPPPDHHAAGWGEVVHYIAGKGSVS